MGKLFKKQPIRPIHGEKRNNYERVLDRTHDILNGGINHGGLSNPGNLLPLGQTNMPGNVDNFHSSVQSPGVANTEFGVTHNLGRIPTGYHIVQKSNPAQFYNGVTAWTTTLIFLKCDQVNINFVIQIY